MKSKQIRIKLTDYDKLRREFSACNDAEMLTLIIRERELLKNSLVRNMKVKSFWK